MRREGEDRLAVQAILGGLRRIPNSLLLWVGLGDALAQHDGGRVSPPALFAFQQARRISPAHPAPPFFLGLAYVRAGDFAETCGGQCRAEQIVSGFGAGLSANLTGADDLADGHQARPGMLLLQPLNVA